MGASSPADHVKVAASPKIAAAKAKALTILNNAPSTSSSPMADQHASEEAPMDLSEQLNDEVRRQYVKDDKLGEGTYANVYRAHFVHDPSQVFAIKKIKVNAEYKDGLTMDAIREVKYLQELSHPNIIKLHAVFSTKDQNLNMVLEFLPCRDLEVLIKSQELSFGAADIKAWMGMVARGIWFCHENFVLHRDIKPNNLLIAADGEVKLADFGLARSFADPYTNMTHNVITRWYRPPELFYRASHYSGAVDVWSMGVVFAELVLRRFWLPGDTDMGQIDLIAQVFGSPREENWPGVSKLDGYIPPPAEKPYPAAGRDYWEREFGLVGQDGISLLRSMLVLDPRKRATSRQVLEHDWWRADPRPTRKEALPRKGGGAQTLGEDLKRRGGELPEAGRADKVARKLDFGSMR